MLNIHLISQMIIQDYKGPLGTKETVSDVFSNNLENKHSSYYLTTLFNSQHLGE